MSVEENIVLMRRWFTEVWNEGRVPTVYELLAENAIGVGHDQPGIEIHGPDDFVALFNRVHGAFPDMKITLEAVFGVDDKVVVHWSAEMTHTGNHLGIPATNKRVRISGITITRIENGKIVYGCDNWVELALIQQGSALVSTR